MRADIMGLRVVVVNTKLGNVSVIDEAGSRTEFDLRSADGLGTRTVMTLNPRPRERNRFVF